MDASICTCSLTTNPVTISLHLLAKLVSHCYCYYLLLSLLLLAGYQPGHYLCPSASKPVTPSPSPSPSLSCRLQALPHLVLSLPRHSLTPSLFDHPLYVPLPPPPYELAVDGYSMLLQVLLLLHPIHLDLYMKLVPPMKYQSIHRSVCIS